MNNDIKSEIEEINTFLNYNEFSLIKNQNKDFKNSRLIENDLLEYLKRNSPESIKTHENLKFKTLQKNYILLQILNIYKKFTERYRLNYHSNNSPIINLSKIYQKFINLKIIISLWILKYYLITKKLKIIQLIQI